MPIVVEIDPVPPFIPGSGVERFIFTLLDPDQVTAVGPLRVYLDDTFTEPPLETVTGTRIGGKVYYDVPTLPDGTYPVRIALTYLDLSVVDDIDDVVTFPVPRVRQHGDPIEPWVTGAELAQDPRLAGADPAVLTLMAQVSTEILYALSGRRFGGARYEVLRVLAPPGGAAVGAAGGVWSVGEVWDQNGSLRDGLRYCGGASTVVLPGQPVTQVLNVSIDGTTLDPASYRVDEGRNLIRTNGSWPVWVDDRRPRLTITYVYGNQPTDSAKYAALIYATEHALREVGHTECRLPRRVTSITRQGVTATILDPHEFVKDGRTGIYEVDAFLFSTNPMSVSRKARLFSPQRTRTVRTL